MADPNNVEFIAAVDVFMTPTCQYADLVIPSTTFFESWDIAGTFNNGAYIILTQKVVEPLYGIRHTYDWMRDVCAKLGVEEKFSEGRSQKEWVAFLLDETRKKFPSVPSWDEMTKQGIAYLPYKTPAIAFQKEIENPTEHPFKTPSGKIELCSKRLYDMKDPEIPATAHYVPCWEGSEDPLRAKYPFQLIGWKNKNRDNSTFFTHPWLKQVAKQVLWINPADAAKKGIKDGAKLKVFNDRGALLIDAHVTERIIPGVVAMPIGAWYNPDANGVDTNGCLNVLTSSRQTPLAKGNAHQSCLVDITLA